MSRTVSLDVGMRITVTIEPGYPARTECSNDDAHPGWPDTYDLTVSDPEIPGQPALPFGMTSAIEGWINNTRAGEEWLRRQLEVYCL